MPTTRTRKTPESMPKLPREFAGPMVQIFVPGHPPSVNKLFFKGRGARQMGGKRPEYVSWEMAVYRALLLSPYSLGELKSLKNRPYRFTLELISESWMNKCGTVRKPDTPNLVKAAEDAVCKVTGWADSANVEQRAVKIEVPGAVDGTRIRFEFA